MTPNQQVDLYLFYVHTTHTHTKLPIVKAAGAHNWHSLRLSRYGKCKVAKCKP